MIRALMALALVAAAPPPAAPDLVVYAAGSTAAALAPLLKEYTAKTSQAVRMVNGPAGLLAKRIEAGERADLFVSADMTAPARLAREGRAGPVVRFARNTLCVTARPDVQLAQENLLDRMLDPSLRVGTSTPGADPAGDYAWALFDRVGSIRPGAAETLKRKARQVLGKSSMPFVGPMAKDAVRYLLETRTVDMVIGYCSANAGLPPPGLDRIAVPSGLAVPIEYGMTNLDLGKAGVRNGSARLVRFLLSRSVQAQLPHYGLLPAR